MSDKKRYFRIGEVASLIGVSIARIRYWERHLPFLKARRTRGGHRLYTYEQVQKFREVKRLVEELKVPLKQVNLMLAGKDKQRKKLIEMYDRLGEIEEFFVNLKEIIKSL
ncbi:MAG: MerR family transcriptional regulator [Chlorobi bacterium]|nr:MerR family transcriptional regulator [Chlorobiota bacterium]